MFIDIHRHSADKGKADIVLRNLFPIEVEEIKQDCFYSVGLHPWHIKNSDVTTAIQRVSEAASDNAVIALGETGIDKKITTSYDLQKEIFLSHIQIANKYNKPLIIHCVKAYDELLKIRKESGHKIPWIIHWYNASPEMGADLIHKGCYLSFGVTLFKENSKAFRTFIKTPLEHVFFETDDADLTILDVYKRAMELKQMSMAELQKRMHTNFYNCFGIKL